MDWRRSIFGDENIGLVSNVYRGSGDAPQSYLPNAEEMNLILNKVFNFIGAFELMELRLISKVFCKIIEEKVQNGIIFHVIGTHSNYKPSSALAPIPIRSLLATSFKWTHIKFTEVDLENDFLRIEQYFVKFTRNICAVSLKSLILMDCYVELGRLIELLSFCPHLQELKFVNCPVIFESGFEIVNWTAFLKLFHARLRRLKRFTIFDSRRNATALTSSVVETWISKMTQLNFLDLRSSTGTFPIQELAPVLSRNVKTLQHLSIVGNCIFEPELISILSNLKLLSLRLGNIKLNSVSDLNVFFRVQKHTLETLNLYNMMLHGDCLDILNQFHKLWQLHLEEVRFVGMQPIPDTPHQLCSLDSLTDLSIQNKIQSCYSWKSLIHESSTFLLTTLVLHFPDVNLLINSFPQPCLKCLKVLAVVDIGKNQCTMRHILIQKVMSLTTLEKLELTDSSLEDIDFAPASQYFLETKPPTFVNLTRLTMLNLSRLEIGDETLLRGVPQLSTLEALHIDGTKVTYNGFRKLAKLRNGGMIPNGSESNERVRILQRLRLISARSCDGLHIGHKLLANLKQLFNGIDFYCDLPRVQQQYSF